MKALDRRMYVFYQTITHRVEECLKCISMQEKNCKCQYMVAHTLRVAISLNQSSSYRLSSQKSGLSRLGGAPNTRPP